MPGIAEKDKRFPSWIAPVLLVTILSLPFLRSLVAYDGLIVGNRKGDSALFFYFVYGFAADCWKSGHIPLWNPYIKFGYPFHAEGQATIFHPATVLFLLFKTGRAINLFLGLHFILGGLFYQRYLRALGIRRTATLLAAAALCYSSLYVGRFHAGHITIVTATTWGLGVLCAWEWYYQSKQRKWLLLYSLAYTLLILSGYPLLTLIFSLFLLGSSLVRAVLDWKASGETPLRQDKTLLYLGAFTALGIGMGAIALLPTFDFAQSTFRKGGSSYEFISSFSYPPESLLTLLFPWFFGQHAPSVAHPAEMIPYVGRVVLWESWVYLGIVPLAAALVGWTRMPGKMKWILGLTSLAALVMALGKYTPVHRLLVEMIPGLGLFRGSSRYILVPMICLMTVAAYGFESWIEMAERPEETKAARKAGLAFIVPVLAVTLFLWLHFQGGAGLDNWSVFLKALGNPGPFESGLLEVTRDNALSGLGRTALLASGAALLLFFTPRLGKRNRVTALLLVLLALDLGPFFYRYFDTFQEASITSVTAALPSEMLRARELPVRVAEFSVLQNMAMTQEFSAVGGYAGVSLQRYNTFLNATQGIAPDKIETTEGYLEKFSPALLGTGLKYLLLDASQVPVGAPGVVSRNQRFALLDVQRTPRVFLASEVRPVEDGRQALDAVMNSDSDLVNTPVVEEWAENWPDEASSAKGTVKVRSFDVNSVSLEVEAPRQSLLVLTEILAPGWRAEVNGHPAAIHPTNYLFRGVVVPPGPSEVIFRYDPPSFRWGAVITLASACLWVLLAFGMGRRDVGKCNTS